MTKVSYNLQNSCDVPKVPQMLTKSLNNWSHAWAGFTHSIFKCCCFIDSHKTSVLFLEMEWQILSFNHVCFKEIHVHSNYPPIWFSMCVEEGLGLTVGFQINLHFQYTVQGNIQICGDYMHVARASDISCKKKQNFVGFLGANSWKNRPISWDFHRKIDRFRRIFAGEKSKFAVKSADFAGF